MPKGGRHVYQHVQIHAQRCELPALYRVCEKAGLYEDVGDSYIGAVFAARSMELWLLEDMGFAVVAKFSVNAGEGEYVTEYRVYKGSDWADSEISLDLEDLVAELAALCDPYYEHEQPIYEL